MSTSKVTHALNARIEALTAENATLKSHLQYERDVARMMAKLQGLIGRNGTAAPEIYKRLATKYHPDKHHNGATFTAEEVMADINALLQSLKPGSEPQVQP